MKSPDVKIVRGLLEQAVPLALEAEARGARVIISRGGTTQLLEGSDLTIPVVDIPVSSINMLRAIHRARSLNPTVTVLGSFRIIEGARTLGKILEMDLEVHEISTIDEARSYVEHRMQSGRSPGVLLGGAVAESLAAAHGLPTVVAGDRRGGCQKGPGRGP